MNASHCSLSGLLAAMVFLGAGCAPTQPKSRQVTHSSLLGRDGGVLLLVDACVQRDGLGSGGDYFVVDETKAGAEAALGTLRKLIQDSGLRVRDEVILICGAPHGSGEDTVPTATKVGGKITRARQPLGATPGIENDPEYLKALTKLSTYAVERAALPPGGSKPGDAAPPATPVSTTVDLTAFQGAATVIRARTGASSICYLGILGKSHSGGKIAARYFGAVLFGTATAVATAGMGGGFYVMFLPGQEAQGVLMEGALVELDSGVLHWSKAVTAPGDPVKPGVIANRETLNLLFHDIMFQSVSAASSADSLNHPKP